MNRKKIIIIGACALAVAALVTVSIISRSRSKPIEVSASDVVLKDFVREVSANGEISSREYTRIFAAVTAGVDEVTVEEGDLVSKNQVIIKLDRESLENNIAIAKNNLINSRRSVRSELLSLRTAYSSALTNWSKANREWKRTSELHKIGSVSDEDLRVVEEQLTVATDNLESSRQKLNFREGRELDDDRSGTWISDESIIDESPEVTKAMSDYDISMKNLKYYEIKADCNGTLTALNVDANSVVEPGTIMAEIYDEDHLVVEAQIDEVDLSYIKTGQDVKITSDSFIGSELKGRVAKIAPIIRKVGDSRVCSIEVDILENPDNMAKIGASASIFITVETQLQKPAVPVEAYFVDDNRKYIFVLNPSEGQDPDNPKYYTVEKREIETGILDIEYVEVSSGLSGGEKVLTGRVPGIEEGTEVVISVETEDEKAK